MAKAWANNPLHLTARRGALVWIPWQSVVAGELWAETTRDAAEAAAAFLTPTVVQLY